MAVYEMTPRRGAPAPLARPVELACFALIVAHAVYLAASYMQGSWLVLPDGGGVQSDFVNVWAAGKLVLQGSAAAAYDWPIHKAMEVMAVGHPLRRLFRLALSADVPVRRRGAGDDALCGGLPGLARRHVSRLSRSPSAPSSATASVICWRAAFPAVLCNFVVGQNGFLTAALIGGALVALVRAPDRSPACCSGF